MDPATRPGIDSPTDWNKQTYIPPAGLEVVPDQPSLIPKPSHDSVHLQNYNPGSSGEREQILTGTEQHVRRRDRICGLRRKWFYILLGAIIVIVIAAVIGGAVGGTVDSSDSDSDSDSNSDSESESNSQGSPGLSFNSSLASVAFNDSSNAMNYRIYYQDEAGMIKESAWNDTQQTWYVSNRGLAKAKRGSPFAAAVTGPPDFNLQINLFFVSSDTNQLQELYTNDGSTWRTGNINTRELKPLNGSGIAAAWHRRTGCANCPNTLVVAYQSDGLSLEIANSTTDNAGYNIYSLPAHAIKSTKLSLILDHESDFIPELRLFYQVGPTEEATDRITSIVWRSPEEWDAKPQAYPKPDDRGWQLHETLPLPIPAGKLPPSSPIAAFALGTLPNGRPQQIQLLYSDIKGLISAISFTGQKRRSWTSAHAPASLAGEKPFAPLAGNSDGRLYSIGGEDGKLREFATRTDAISWAKIGNVTTI